MTESAEQRTKRKFIEYLDLGIWTHQYSFFYQDSQDARSYALGDAKKLKEKLRRRKALRFQPFLYRLCLYKANAFHTVFTNAPVDIQLLSSISLKLAKVEFKVIGREFPSWRVERYRRAINRQKPHDLKGFFGDKKINRFALLNYREQSSV